MVKIFVFVFYYYHNHDPSMISNFQAKPISISIGIGNTGPVITWYRSNTKICSIAQPWAGMQQIRRATDPVEVNTDYKHISYAAVTEQSRTHRCSSLYA